jgi:hypothetical protein
MSKVQDTTGSMYAEKRDEKRNQAAVIGGRPCIFRKPAV